MSAEFCLLGYNAVQSVKWTDDSEEHVASISCYLLHAGFFDSEDGVDIYFPNIGRLSTEYMALYLAQTEHFITNTVRT
jgi:hypothetical protein